MVLNFLDSFFLQVSVKGKNYRRQLTAATREARRAAKMSLQVLPLSLGFSSSSRSPISYDFRIIKTARNCLIAIGKQLKIGTF